MGIIGNEVNRTNMQNTLKQVTESICQFVIKQEAHGLNAFMDERTCISIDEIAGDLFINLELFMMSPSEKCKIY